MPLTKQSEAASYFQLWNSWNLNYTVLTMNQIIWEQQIESTSIKKPPKNQKTRMPKTPP